MAKPETIADVYAQMKAREGAQDLLDANKKGERAKATAAGLGAGIPILALSATPALLRFQAEYPNLVRQHYAEVLKQSAEQAGQDPALVDALFATAAKHPNKEARESAEKLIEQSLETATKKGLDIKLPSSKVWSALGANLKGPALAAIPAALLGAAAMYRRHGKKLEERERFLDEIARHKKTASVAFLNEMNEIETSYGIDLIEKIAEDPAAAAQAGMLAGGVQNEAAAPQQTEVVRNESMPAHGVVASRIQQLDPRRAVGIPVMQPPPGYIYNPELASFVPNEQDPGWIAQSQVIEAARNKGWYDRGQQDVVAAEAQQQIDQQATQGIQQAMMQEQAAQQQAALQQQAQMQATLAAAREKGRASARMSLGQEPVGDRRVPREQAVAGKKGKGVVIQVGR